MQPIPIVINGYDTYYVDCDKKVEPYLLIFIPQNAGKDISHICGSIVCNRLIKQVNYEMIDQNRFIKAYY
ncbi:hypothetical protein LXJ15735_04580 [Lacrimispora xylanolytica]